jgi:hypothetical protein
MLGSKVTEIEKQLKAVLAESALEKLGKQSGFVQRKRTITATKFAASLLHSLGTRKVETIADLHRDFNCDNGIFVNYKPYYDKLDNEGFAEFMRLLFEEMMSVMCLKVLRPQKEGPFNVFRDIAIHDGSSFALHDSLSDEFSGRFTAISPAAVELHATMSLFEDNLTGVTITSDSECERHFTPDAKELVRKLFMADRGFDSKEYMNAIDQAGGSYLIRARSISKPKVVKIRRLGRRYRELEGRRLDRVLKAVSKSKLLDVDVCWENRLGEVECRCRIVLKYNRSEKSWMRLMTNLPRSLFTAKAILLAYRLRWQVELYFKELKSYANLHRFCTSKATIAEGLFWASLCVAFLKRYFAHACQYACPGREISTRRVAMCGHAFLRPIFWSMLRRFRGLHEALTRAFDFLFNNAMRSNPRRERKKGRLALGLAAVGVAG